MKILLAVVIITSIIALWYFSSYQQQNKEIPTTHNAVFIVMEKKANLTQKAVHLSTHSTEKMLAPYKQKENTLTFFQQTMLFNDQLQSFISDIKSFCYSLTQRGSYSSSINK